MNELIQKLVESYGPSGFEDHIRELIRTEVTPYADDISVDAMGNLIVHKKGDGPKVMIAAHMDEIGIMVTHVTEEGFLRFTNLGGVFPQHLLGGRVLFADGTIGVIYADRHTDRSSVHPLSKHYIDVGATSRDTCPIQVGDAAGFYREFFAQGDMLTAKSMDDRIGCVVAIEALKQLTNPANDLYFVFTVQEEVGTRGAMVTANQIQPDIGLAIDVTLTGDTPECRPMAVALGKGPAIKLRDNGMIAHTGLVRYMKETADSAGIPYQLEVLDGGSTDARSIQISGAGAAAGCISIACRYVHSPSETVHKRDVEQSIALLIAMLNKPINL